MNDPLHDQLLEASRSARLPLSPAHDVRARAERGRTRRRAAVAGLAGAALVAGIVTVGGVPGSSTAPPDTSPAATVEPTPSPASPTRSPQPPAVLDVADLEAAVEAFRFVDEPTTVVEEFPVTVESTTSAYADSCEEVPLEGAVAGRRVVASGPDSSLVRHVVAFPDAAAADEALEEYLSRLTACEQGRTGEQVDGGLGMYERSYLGGDLSLGDESSWTAERMLPVGDPDGEERVYSGIQVVVRQGSTLVVMNGAAIGDAGRRAAIAEISAEYELNVPGLEALQR